MNEYLAIFVTCMSCMYLIASRYPKTFTSIEFMWKALFYLSACYISFSLGAKYPETTFATFILKNDTAIFIYFLVVVSPYYLIKMFFSLIKYNKEPHVGQ